MTIMETSRCWCS